MFESAFRRLLASSISGMDRRSIQNRRASRVRKLNGLRRRVVRHWPMMDMRSPSWVASLNSQRRQLGRPHYGWEASESGLHAEAIWELDRKLASYQFVNALGIKHPSVLANWSSPEEISLDALPEEFCLKPDHSASARGVFVLKRQPNKCSYVDLLRDRMLSEADIRNELSQLVNTRRISKRIFAEESLVSTRTREPVDDWKLYTFYGEVGLALQVRKAEGKRLWKFYSGDFSPLQPMREREKCDNSLPPPSEPDCLKAMAETISKALPLPFVRVDLYESERPDGTLVPVFGELTPTPGGDHLFPPPIDQHLGSMWEAAAQRLLDDLIEGKRFTEWQDTARPNQGHPKPVQEVRGESAHQSSGVPALDA